MDATYPTGSFHYLNREEDDVDIATPRPDSTNSLQISIVGAGVAGLSAAIALRREGHDVTVFESTPYLSEVGSLLLSHTNSSLLQCPSNSRAVLDRRWHSHTRKLDANPAFMGP